MARSTGIVLAVGGITAANEVLFAPLAGQKVSFNWRIVPATAGLALALAALERIAPEFAVGLAWLSLVTVLLVPFGNAPTPLANANKILGYGGKLWALEPPSRHTSPGLSAWARCTWSARRARDWPPRSAALRSS
jgi:hypothetical protein